MKTVVIIPAFNEEAAISRVIEDLVRKGNEYTIVVVNDGSSDGTSALARNTGKAVVLDLPLNLGIGGAVQTGFKYAVRNRADIAVQFDGDGQHNADEIPLLLKPIIDGSADVVIGSRFVEKREGFKSTISRRIGIGMFRIINSLLIKQSITDNTSGFRAYNRESLCFLAENYPSDYPEPEAVILLGKNGFRIKEVFVTMKERQGGVSSITGVKTVYYMIKVLLAVFMTALRGRK
jgi:glycosyltransferase involved in cell wall biosynthesis